MKVVLSGANGAMGHVLAEQIDKADDLEVIAGIDQADDDSLAFPVYGDPADIEDKPDVIIDFSHFSAFPKVFGYAKENGIPIVIATTGLSDEDLAMIDEAKAELPVFRSANMSLGINVLVQALQAVSAALEADYDIEIYERHHNKKKDAPSGTALLLADGINEVLKEKKTYNTSRTGRDCARQKNEIGITASRGGTIPGEHTVLFAGDDELIEFKHTALSKKIFANGAITAARWIVDQKPGEYDMLALLADS